MDQQVKDLINNEITDNEVCLFMKGTPEAPQCGFSLAVSNMLKILEVNYKGINVLENSSLREGIKEFSEWPTIPQLYIKSEFVGGCDIVKEMYESGELKKILEDKALVLIFEFTIGNKISQIYEKVDVVSTKEGRKESVNKIRKEIKRATKKERYLSKEDARLINLFINKIKKELQESE